ncbi:MAG: putative transporter substrate binding protein [Candidatus Berkelbacteria bacterium]|nr:putative transporter substrate binding protein [Candidatus Berkelbacteria bacterium]
MKKISFNKIFQSVKKFPIKETAVSCKYLPKVCSRIEKIILLSLFGMILFALVWMIVQYWIGSTKLIPKQGGVFREGIVGESKDLDKQIARLTNAGLTKYDQNKNIVSDMAEKWEILEGGKVYKFTLRPDFNSQDLANQIIGKDLWKDIDISTPDPSTLTFTFKQPFSPFLYTSTQPLFPYGPYQISKESKNEVDLTINGAYYNKKPYIGKIIIKLYSSKEDAIKAAKRGDIDGYGLAENTEAPNEFLKFELNLPRDLIVFFNLNNKSLQDINVRKALKEGTDPKKDLNLRLVTSDTPKNVQLAKNIVEKWASIGVKVNLEIKDNVTMQKTIIPKRDYDLLLYGLDYGADPDPYPFWHSSQIKEDGMNLSNFKNTKADKLLEQARLEFDFKKRQDMYAQFQQILDSEVPMFVVEHQNFYYYTRESVYGIEYIVGSNESDRFLEIANWYIDTKRVKK